MNEIPKAYEPQSVEDKWYDFWLKQGCFTANPARVTEMRPAYSIVIPPPNVTGMLHMGHVLNNAIQDILARKARMDGKEVLWLPGTDHAGIATQVQVERALKKEERLTKHDLGREKFLERVWQWKEKHGGIIIQQLKKLGCSCDWTRERFTMDAEYSRCVQKVFVELYRKGLIYRGKRMVNWCPATQTALSDEEVEMESQKGFLYYFKVRVAESLSDGSRGHEAPAGKAEISQSLLPSDATGERKGGPEIDSEGRFWVTIATTRPETIPGDTAIAVNPKDPRYAHLIGKHAIRPLPAELPHEQKLIPIIGDEYVDFEFGTGVLKVTPAHDKNDFDIGQRHKLTVVDIMNPNGSMNELAGKDLAGLDRFEARKVAVEKLKELGVLEKEEPYENKIGFSQRAHVPIEPRLSEQWFLKYPAVEQSKACVEQEDSSARVPRTDSGVAPESLLNKLTLEERASGATPDAARETRALPGKMRFHPQRWAKVYDHWLSNIQDWCISRQLWWGHRIPVWVHRQNENSAIPEYLPASIHPDLESVGQQGGKEISFSRKPGHTTFIRYEELFRHELNIYAATTSSEEAKELERLGFAQDPDVLDTWFSSWLWPFATMGWTGDKSQDSNTPTLQAFYPTTDLVTGPDIIFFWVARMIMAGYEFMGELPFHNVYFTGIIRDKQGRKMSKTLGNSPDPLELIARYGADALRFGTMRSAPLGQDVLFDEKDVELGRNFCNKLWNACRFRQLVGQASHLSPSDPGNALASETGATPVLRTEEVQRELNPSLLTSDDKWILLKLDAAIREVTDAVAGYQFNTAAHTLYRFFWSEYCDWYVEASKVTLSRPIEPLNREAVESPTDSTIQRFNDSTNDPRRANKLAVIDFVLDHTLRLFHPFLPFITEELWHGMGYAAKWPADEGGRTIMTAPWPKPLERAFRDQLGLDDCYLEIVNAKFELVTQGRNLRREANIAANKKVRFVLRPLSAVGPHDVEVIKLLLNADAFNLDPEYQPTKGTPTVRTALGDLFLPLEGLRSAEDVAAEIARLTKELEKIQGEITKVEQKLANPNFTQKAPPEVLQDHYQRLAEWQAKREHVQEALKALQG